MGTFHRHNDFYTVQNTHHKKKKKTFCNFTFFT